MKVVNIEQTGIILIHNFFLKQNKNAAINLDDAEFAKEEFREKWDKKYPNILKFWDKNWSELATFFEYPQEIRKIIYTTNAVESYRRMVRKFTKSKAIFPTNDSIRKSDLYYFTPNVETKILCKTHICKILHRFFTFLGRERVLYECIGYFKEVDFAC